MMSGVRCWPCDGYERSGRMTTGLEFGLDHDIFGVWIISLICFTVVVITLDNPVMT